jgi:hypothetical protein
MDSAYLLWSSLFALIGMAAFVFGRKQRRGAPTLFGVALMVYPFFVSNALQAFLVGALLVVGLVVGNRFEEGI